MTRPPLERGYVAIDLGAASGRVILGRHTEGVLSMKEVHRFANEPVAYHGGLYWDIQRLWLEIQNGLRSVAAIVEGQPLCIGADGWGVDFALLGEGGVLIENPHHYRDPRSDGVMEKVLARLGADEVYRTTGAQFFPFNTLYQLYSAWLHTPCLLECATALLTIPDLINFWLTGSIGCEFTNATTTQFLNSHTRQWAPELLQRLGIPSRLLAPIVEPGTLLGAVRPELGARLGIESAVVAVPACHDTASAVAAVQARDNKAFISSGSWSLLGTEVTQPVVTAESQLHNFANEGGVGDTYMLLKNITGLWLLEGCRRKWKSEDLDPGWEDILRRAASSETAFAHLFDPDDAAFVRPDDMTAAIDDVCRRTRQSQPRSMGAYTRAVLESLAFKYRRVLESLESVTGTHFEEIRVIGGGSQNALLNQFTANATGCRVVAGPTEATALGNIAMQMVATGDIQSIGAARELIEQSFPPEIFVPESRAHWERGWRRYNEVAPA